ncbi:hypothetical protein NW757_014078 [Fusarium falciforme]|nr:hypothetical protein NW757_014078 [Fusarium falciforme]
MSATKRALLIASPTFGLRGPLNDVRLMNDALAGQGFDITPCCDKDATREGILEACRKIIRECGPDDTLVIYYSGHGGLVEDASLKQQSNEASISSSQRTPWRYQFLVPTDFRINDDDKDENDFNGILDAEVKQLRAEASKRTRNVTIILDCCHSGSMSRHPTRPNAIPRSLPRVQHAVLSRHYDLLRSKAQTSGPDQSGDVVTIVAAGATETAWDDYITPDQAVGGMYVGCMTKAFTDALTAAWKSQQSGGEPISWRTLLVRVSDSVNARYPQQHPHVEGPSRRIIFSLKDSSLNALELRVESATLSSLQAGKLLGVRQGSVYGLWPLHVDQRNEATRLGIATVTNILANKALTKLDLLPNKELRPGQSALAVLEKETLRKWPIAYPSHLKVLGNFVEASTHLCTTVDQQDGPLAEVSHDGTRLILKDTQGLELVSQHISDNDADSMTFASRYILSRAEALAKAQHLRTLTCDNPDEFLDHKLHLVVGTTKNGEKDMVIQQDGSGYLTENDNIYVHLENQGTEQLYASVFNINAWGKISLVSSQLPRGIDLPPGKDYTLGAGEFGIVSGLPISWPTGVPKARPIDECLFVIVTDSPLNLTSLEDCHADGRGSGPGPSTLEQVAFSIATGSVRDIGSQSRSLPLRWNLMQINLALRPLGWQEEGRRVHPEDIPEPNDLVPAYIRLDPGFFGQPEAKSVSGLIRKWKGVPPYVRVVNKHDEEILVVVSKHRPGKQLTEIGVDASAAGGGANFACSTFQYPVCKKTLAPYNETGDNNGIMGIFPLWTRKEGFGVVSIYKGPQRKLYIENDQIPIGATAYFSNTPNLELFDYEGKAMSTGYKV